MEKLFSALALSALILVPSYSIVTVQTHSSLQSRLSETSDQAEAAPSIQNLGTGLSEAEAVQVAEDLQARIARKYEPTYSLDRFKFEFEHEETKNGFVGIDVSVNVEMTLKRDPSQSPYAKGMEKGKAALTEEAEKEAAQEKIDDFLEESESYLDKPSNSWLLYHIRIPEAEFRGTSPGRDLTAGNSRLNYELFYREDVREDEKILSPAEPAAPLNESEAESDGIETVREAASKASRP
ncbi:hypothetical protein [Saccharibacillus alkalitolerans]|uniref:Uncharacterized protein n=1 Tax=Saccharibacillus alkalitolerans TaxID=2705290 RepID=A0ABX0F5B5_9BACL|nr:hypothetical protein [Saccharibacillus alkalitolerans]NGZ75665.1 hypothetical protein [Saccharibacillus alkalitolerans]